MASSPVTPTNRGVSAVDPSFSMMSMATTRGSPPGTPPATPPATLRRQNAFVLEQDSADGVGEMDVSPVVAGSNAPTTDADDGANMEEMESESGATSDADTDLVTFLDGDSDSDENLPAKERVKQRMGWINQDWKDMVSWNASFHCSSQPWEKYLRDQMIEHGYSKINNQWVKTGPPTRHNRDSREQALARIEERKRKKANSQNAASSSKGPMPLAMKKAPMKKPAAKKVMKSLTKAMKAMKASSKPSSSSSKGDSTKSQKVAKTSPRTKKITPPVTPQKKKVLDMVDKTPSPKKAVLDTPPKMGLSKRRTLGLSRSSPVSPKMKSFTK